jgi:Domain of unknown function (DUF6457)
VTDMTLDEWMDTAAAALGLTLSELGDLSAVRGEVLDLARDAAHGVARPAAPLTTFLVGVAVGQGRPDLDLAAAAAIVRGLIPAGEPD